MNEFPTRMPSGSGSTETPVDETSSRNVHWFLGLGFDCIGMEEARRRIFEAVATRNKLIFATPNVNFLAEANRDSGFRRSILSTRLSLVDGMPLVWLGRLLGIPFTQRVAGSSLVERLQRGESVPKLRVFFFGGEPDVARTACQALARSKGPMAPAGWCDPGFVSIEEMSRPEIIAAINAAKPDMIIVSLGAKKGHFWIDRNRDLLEAPVISHLGAAVGFVSGHLRRAPVLLQRTGFEWLWRMAMEPRLIPRYIGDAGFLASALVTSVAPILWRRLWQVGSKASVRITTVSEDAAAMKLSLEGSLRRSNLVELSARLAAAGRVKQVLLDISRLGDADSTAIGYFYHLKFRAAARCVQFTCDPGSPGARLLTIHRAQCLTWRNEEPPIRLVTTTVGPVVPAPALQPTDGAEFEQKFQPVARTTARG